MVDVVLVVLDFLPALKNSKKGVQKVLNRCAIKFFKDFVCFYLKT